MNRPAGVTLIAVLYFIFGVLWALGGVGMVAGGDIIATVMKRQGQAGGTLADFVAGLGAALGVVFLIFGVLDISIGVGLIKLKDWARMTSIILAAIGAALGVLGLLRGLAHFILVPHFVLFATIIRVCALALEIWMVIYLLKPEVKAAFQAPPLGQLPYNRRT
ncbi:MAG TPA: hypothetical protein VKH81_03995 [Candidatus Angelobacter sp.]|nr:hypothetical protein [Candidatus Angelobacter sp.]